MSRLNAADSFEMDDNYIFIHVQGIDGFVKFGLQSHRFSIPTKV